jgi:flagellar biosynthesis protein FlhG
MMSVSSPKLTAIGSGKGGTGKTLVATGLASALAHEGERVLLCDADFGLSNTTIHLGLATGGDLAGLVDDRVALADAIVPVCGGSAARGGFDLIAAPAGSGALANLDPGTAGRLAGKLRASRAYDRVLIDLSAGVDALTMALAAHADETLLVLNADPASLTDAYAFAKTLLRLGGGLPKSIVNMAESVGEGRRTAETLAKTCQAFLKATPDFIGSIPRDARASAAVRLQAPLTALYPQSPSALAIVSLARRLHGVDQHNVVPMNAKTIR